MKIGKWWVHYKFVSALVFLAMGSLIAYFMLTTTGSFDCDNNLFGEALFEQIMIGLAVPGFVFWFFDLVRDYHGRVVGK